MIDLDAPITQQQFGHLVGIAQPTVSDWCRRGLLREGGTAGEWLRSYCDRLREMASGRGGDDGPALVAERARLAREQADKVAMQNAVTRSELAPAWLLEQVLAKTGARVGNLLNTIPGALRRRFPQLTAEDLADVAVIVAKVRNMAASMRLSDLDADEELPEQDAANIAELPPLDTRES